MSGAGVGNDGRLMVVRAGGASRDREGGFTLVELLVVVVILGVLSAVVVFSVRGADDKGRAQAVATDERVLRTAEETYCAQAGQYASMPQLTGEAPAGDGKFYKVLNQPSEYQTVTAVNGNPPNPGPPGPCNGWSYTIGPPGPATSPSSAGTSTTRGLDLLGTCDGDPAQWPKDRWCPAANPAASMDIVSSNAMVRLSDGKVLGRFPEFQGGRRILGGTKLFDPTVGVNGSWSPSAPTPKDLKVEAMVLIEGTRDICGDLCGNVLMAGWGTGIGNSYYFYDPGNPGWEHIFDDGYGHSETFAMVQLKGSKCVTDCGKILIVLDSELEPQNVGRPGRLNHVPEAQIFDPKTKTIRTLAYPTETHRVSGAPAVAQIDGEVLIAGADRVYNPTTGFFDTLPHALVYTPNGAGGVFTPTENEPANAYYHEGIGAVATGATPATSKVLLGTEEIYDPATRRFHTLTPCGVCAVVAVLPNGNVLARQTAGDFNTRKTFVFDPVTETWIPTVGDLNDSQSATGKGVLLTGPGCGPHCGRVLVAGNQKAELYTPGPVADINLLPPPSPTP